MEKKLSTGINKKEKTDRGKTSNQFFFNGNTLKKATKTDINKKNKTKEKKYERCLDRARNSTNN